MNKIVLYSKSLNSLNLISFLISKKLLGVVAVANVNDMETYTFIQSLNQYKIPYFIYGDDDSKNLDTLKSVEVNLALVFEFPFKISLSIIEYFKGKIYNYHVSKLPKYRGKLPLFWQIKNGETKSILTLHKLTKEFNAGDIIVQKEFDIDYQDTYGVLNSISSQLIVNVTIEFLEKLDEGRLNASAQIEGISYTREIKEEDLTIDWKTMISLDIYNLCRACNPIFGGAKSILKNSQISILETTIVDMDNLGLEAGTIIHIGSPEGLIVSTIDGTIRIDILSVSDGVFSGLRFAKCFNIEAGERLKKS